jgi:hypothetical protein
MKHAKWKTITNRRDRGNGKAKCLILPSAIKTHCNQYKWFIKYASYMSVTITPK